MALNDRNQAVRRLREELDRSLNLVVMAQDELHAETTRRLATGGGVDDKQLAKIKALSASFASLTDSKIRLLKAERDLEDDITDAEEREAVVLYLAALEPVDMRTLCKQARERRGEIPGLRDSAPETGWDDA